MAQARPSLETPHSVPLPRLLVELPSWPGAFFENARDLVFPRRLSPLELRSAPGPFWPDVFVQRSLPWNRFLQSGLYHIAAGVLLVGLAHIFTLQPRVAPEPAFDHSQVVYYRPSEYLPPLDTRSLSSTAAPKADPEFSRQPIISVPQEADNRSQTVVTAPNLKLKQDVRLPNVISWSDAPKPRLAIPAAPLSPAAQITRLAPLLESSVAAPLDAARLAHNRKSPTLQDPVAAPPSDLRGSRTTPEMQNLQAALVVPPPTLETSPSRRIGDLNIAPTPVVAPAPQLQVADQRGSYAPRVVGDGGPPVVPPPPTVAASGPSGPASGSPGRFIALNLHPAIAAPPDPPAGNRRGTFAATPEGHAGASGHPGSVSGNIGAGTHSGTADNGSGGAAAAKGSNVPSGLYVGPAAKPSAVAGDPAANAPATSVNPNLIASVHPPRVTAARPMQPESAAKLSEPERAVFGSRRFYSVTLNMPNLNSAGGSWVIRFAELKHDAPAHDANAPAADLSQPMATRKVDPAYPTQLMRENVHGTVILYAVIHADGSVGDVRVLRGVDERLDRYATEAVAKWKFDPATKNGAPVDVEATFQIPFRPARVGTNF
jgi:TonB family protein